MKKNKIHIILFFFAFLLGINSYATKRYWRGTGATKNWNTTTNWSATSGGTTGSSVPVSTDSVYFDSGGDSICTINAAVSIKYLNIASGYTHTISQNANAITIGTSGAVLSGGTFSGGSSNITDNGIFTLSGTNFTSTSAILSISGNYTFSSGTFSHNNGEVSFAATLTISGNNSSFYKLTFTTGTYTISSSDTLTVNNELKTTGASASPLTINTGNIFAKGDITISNTSTSATSGGTATITINGTGSQILTGASTDLAGRLCNITINKSGGTLSLKKTINVMSSWKYIAGTIDASTDTSTVVFTGNTLGRKISGTHALYNVKFYSSTGTTTNTIKPTDTLTVLGTLTTTGVSTAAAKLDSGIINTKGDINVLNALWVIGGVGGTATILINGTGNQTIIGSTILGAGRLGNIKINKSSGTLYLKNILTLEGDWIYLHGTFDALTYSSTLLFGGGTTRSIQGSLIFYNLGMGGGTNNINATDTLTVNNELTLLGTGVAPIINTGLINAKGDITVTNLITGGGGTGLINICGTGNQTLTGPGIAGVGRLCKINVNKSSDTLFLSNIINIAGDWTYSSGIVNPGTSTVINEASGNVSCGTTLSSAMAFNNYRVQLGTTTLTGVLKMNGNLTIDASRTLNASGKTMSIGGNWSNSGTFTPASNTVTFAGSGSQYLTKSSGTESFYAVEVNKPSGKLHLNNPVSITNTLTLTKGIIGSTSTNIVSFPDNATCTGGSDSGYVSGPVKKIGNDAFTFPLGDSVLSTGAYHPLTITAPSVTTDSYTATYRDSVQTAGATIQTDSLTSISTCERWLLTRNAGSSTVVPTLGWNSNSCNVDGCHRLRVSGWDGSQWKSLGYNGVTTSGSSGTVKAHSGLSQTSLPLVIALPINSSLAPTVTISCNNPTICSGHSTSITGNGASTYSWAPSTGLSATTGGTVIASPTTGITYTVTGTNALGCTGTSTIAISVNTSPTVAVTPTSSVIGTGSSVSLTASGASTYSWLPTTDLSPTTGASVTSTPAASITYTVTGTDVHGCTGTATSAITVEAACALTTLVSGSVCIQTPVNVSASGSKGCVEIATLDMGDSSSVTDTVSIGHPVTTSHTYSSVGSYVITISIYDLSSHLLRTDTSHITVISCTMDCDDCIPSFAPIPAKKYELSAWTKQGGAADTVTNYTKPKITVSSTYGSYSVAFTPSGPIIDGWQKIDGEFTLPGLATDINIKLESTSGDCYFDDIRVFPFDGSMKSYVYDPVNMRLVAELDERNYATLYEYDEEGKLVRVKKETERGIMTIKENRNNTSK